MDLTPVAPSLRPAARLVINTIAGLIRPDWQDVEKLPHGPAIIVVNHISNVDPLLVGAFLARNGSWPRFLAKDSLFRIPILGRILTGIAQIPVHRGTATAGDALESAVAAIDKGGCVVIYPEGTITTDPELWPMRAKTGAARLAQRTGAPVVPVGQWGAEQILYGKRLGMPRFLPRKKISMVVGDPLDLADLPVDRATQQIMTVLTGLVGRLRGEIPPGAYDPDK